MHSYYAPGAPGDRTAGLRSGAGVNRPVIRVAEGDTRRRWRRRRFRGLTPFIVLVAVDMTLLTGTPSAKARTLGLILAASVVVLAIILGGTVLHDRRTRREAESDALFASFGRLPVADLQAEPRFAEMLARCDIRRITSWSRGLVEGRIVLTSQAIRFTPGRIASKAGVVRFEIPWTDVADVQVVPMALDLNTGMEVSLRTGGVLHWEVRGEGPLTAALATL